MTDNKSKPVIVYILQALVLFQGLSGLAGGIGLLMDPTGQSLQIPIEWLQGSPFSSYFIPGLVLLTVLGFYPLFLFYALLKKKNRVWSGNLLLGIGLLIWILVEIWVIGYQAQPPLQIIYGLVGLVILLLSLSKPARSFLRQH